MKALYWIALVALAATAIYLIPSSFPSSDWARRYAQWTGATDYVEPPANQPVQIPPLDLDRLCPPEYSSWRAAQTIEGVEIDAVSDCLPDNPYDVAVSVRGANNVSQETLLNSLFAPDTIEKSEDRDGDGDPDLIEIRLEVMELNGNSPDGDEVVPQFEIGPGITPGFWVFAPKTRGMTTENFESLVANRIIRLPAPAIRIEQGDEVRITLENTHYLPHTIHFHGVDHAFQQANGEGNDGVPVFGEHAVMPGAAKTYVIQARHPGAAFYHCHVQPQVHILMGLQGMLVVEENRPDNFLQTFNIGAGRVRVPSVAVRETSEREFDLHYLEIDSRLNNRIQAHNDPRLISRSVHRGYNITERKANYFVLNGRSFPYTLRESLVAVTPGTNNRLRVLNGGAEGLALHIHGHKPRLTHRDGVALGRNELVQRDVFWVASAQRVDLQLDTTNDGRNAYGEGAWFMHDHREQAVTSNGIGPGGDISMVVYEEFLGERGLPQTVMGLSGLAPFFTSDYYAGRLPVFAGMAGHTLFDPLPANSSARSRIGFYGVIACLVMLLLVPWLRARRR